MIDEPTPYIVPEETRRKLQEFARGLAEMNQVVQTMKGVERGIVEREFAKETVRLEDERYKKDR